MRRKAMTLVAALAATAAIPGAGAWNEPLPVALGPGVGHTVHVPPVTGPVIDPFRPPEHDWLPGNRGIEYDTEPGEIAAASAAGVVVFAGTVAGAHHVTIRHTSRLRTTVAFVSEPLVAVGDRVRAGQPVAIVGDTVHFTARFDGVYIDPALLLVPHRWRVQLIPAR